MSRRGVIGGAIIALWVGGLGVLAQRELFRPEQEQLSEAALRVTPGAMYYAVMHEDEHVGYASSNVDTLPDTLRVTDYLVADLPVGRRTQRAEARSEVLLTRAMRLRSFTFSVASPSVNTQLSGRLEGDSTLVVVRRDSGRARPDTQRLEVNGNVVLPTVVPLLAVLKGTAAVGRSTTVDVFDPLSNHPQRITARLTAETTFVIPDSAVFDSTSGRWRGEIPITTRAFHLETGVPSQLNGWVDEQGRMTRAMQLATLRLERMPHEMAFENWRIVAKKRPGARPVRAPGDTGARPRPNPQAAKR